MPKDTETPTEVALDAQRATRLSKLYLAFCQDPLNDQFDDSRFCSEQSISLKQLEVLKTSDILRSISQSEFTDKQLRSTVDNILRKANRLLAAGTVGPKSMEGLMNAFTNLLKQKQLLAGNPTERIEIDDLRKKSPEDLHRWLMHSLSGKLARN